MAAGKSWIDRARIPRVSCPRSPMVILRRKLCDLPSAFAAVGGGVVVLASIINVLPEGRKKYSKKVRREIGATDQRQTSLFPHIPWMETTTIHSFDTTPHAN